MESVPWHQQLKAKRTAYGVSQNKLAVHAGISRQYVSEIETGKANPTENLKHVLMDILEQWNPEAPLEILFDYARIRFLTTDPIPIIEDVLQLKMEYMIHEDHAMYSYMEQYIYGEIVVMVSPEPDKGCLLEMKGQGCRQLENFLLAQQRTWLDFWMTVLQMGAVFKRIDIAINDKVNILDIPFLTEKCQREECVSKFRRFKSYRSGELIRGEEKKDMGETLYIGSLKSDVNFCVYEKDYEQFVKYGTDMTDTDVKNRLEIRLKNDRAYHAILDLMMYEDAGKTAFSIIQQYFRFADTVVGKRYSSWPINAKWQRFLDLGEAHKIRLTTQPEPYTLAQTLRWLSHQVAPTWKLDMKIDELNHTTVLDDILKHAKLTDKHQKIIMQQTCSMNDIIKES